MVIQFGCGIRGVRGEQPEAYVHCVASDFKIWQTGYEAECDWTACFQIAMGIGDTHSGL